MYAVIATLTALIVHDKNKNTLTVYYLHPTNFGSYFNNIPDIFL